MMYSEMGLPIELQNIVKAELGRDEEVVWETQTEPGRFAMQALPIVMFAIPWTAFSVFWILGAAGFKMPDFSEPQGFFCLFGLPFFFIGVGMLSSPYRLRNKARKTAYVITNKRAIIFSGGRGTKIESFDPKDLGDVTKVIRNNGGGDLVFLSRVRGSYNSNGDSRRNVEKVGFIAVRDISEASRQLEDLKDRHRKLPPAEDAQEQDYADEYSERPITDETDPYYQQDDHPYDKC